MIPIRIPPAPRMVQLKHSVDIQLDHVFHEGQWTVAANLARQRHKSTKDEYYRAVEIAAKSRGDNPTDHAIGEEVVQTMVNENTTIKDVDALDLYEFAIHGLSMDYTKTIGVLRVRLVKSLPKDQNAGLKCLEACMWYSDWENAQEIAVSLNKNFPLERKYLFYNILTTILVAASDSTHENKKKLFPNLAKAQADKAFNLRPTAGQKETSLGQLEISQNELLLWLEIRIRFGSPQENLKLLSLPLWNPLVFLERGLTDAYQLAMILLCQDNQWDEFIRVANAVFDKVILIGKEKPAAVESTGNKDKISRPSVDDIINERYMNAAREWATWVSMLDAANHHSNHQKFLKAFRKKIEKVVPVLRDYKRMSPVFEKNYDRILLAISFARASMATVSDGIELGVNKVYRLVELSHKILRDPSGFATLKPFLRELNKEETANYVRALGTTDIDETKDLGMFDDLLLVALRLRVMFFEVTSLKAGEECQFCNSVANDGPDCKTCIKSIAKRAFEAFRLGLKDESVSQIVQNEIEDPLSNLAVLGSICLLKIAGAGRRNWQYKKESPLYNTDLQLFLQAVVWLDFYLRKTPRNDALRLLLVKMYLMMGCVTQALQVWNRFDVKNTLLECLGSLCLDRLASISPAHFVPGSSRHSNFADAFLRHFESAIQKKYPDTVTKTLQNGSYAQLTEIIKLVQEQGRNCVLVLAVVENRRGMRLKSGRSESAIEDEPLIGSLSPNYQLQDGTDYTPFPNWGGPYSNRRCHLSILAERFIDLVCYVQPKDFKPSKANQLLHADWHAANSSCKTFQENLDTLLYGEEYENDNDLTDPETWYFRVVTELTKFVKLLLEHVLLETSTKQAREEILAVVKRTLMILGYQTQGFLSVPDGIPTKMHTLHGVAALHAMGMLRESSLATKNTVQYISAAIDRVKATDKSRGANEVAWLSPELKKLSAAATLADTQMKDRVKKLSDNLHTSGWVDRLEDWAFGDTAVLYEADSDFKSEMVSRFAEVIPKESFEAWAIDVADSWRDVVKGWSAVKFD
ncbi:hypothetical protein HD806DRAFT_523531 [Xylariaceae sp. AK1471]|nr:hypothetical protein HD806DRAFT_523531 [Xylariaceae sp. AK1471]